MLKNPKAVDTVVDALFAHVGKYVESKTDGTNADANKAKQDSLQELFKEQIKSFIAKATGKKNGVRYSAANVRLALEIWTRSKPAYRSLASTLNLPHERTLQSIKSQNKVRQGLDPDRYINALRRNTGEGGDCICMCDEVKIVAGLGWNTQTHELVGFQAMGGYDVARLANIFLDDSDEVVKKKDKDDLCVKVNQFKLVFLFSKFTVLGEFFSNCGSLTAEELR